MDLKILNEPAGIFVFTTIITILFLFIETRVRKEKKGYRDYIVYGIYTGMLSVMLLYIFQQNNVKDKVIEQYLINRF